MSKPERRLAIVLSHPTQYYSPWFRWLSGHSNAKLRVFYLWDFGVTHQTDPNFSTPIKWDVDLLSGYDHEFVPNVSPRPGAESFFGFSNPGLTKRLSKWAPDALLLFGYKWASHLRVVMWALSARVPIIFRGDSHLIGRGPPNAPTRASLGFLFSRFAAFLCVGEANRAYFKAFGVPDSKLFFAPHSVDDTLYDATLPENVNRAKNLRSLLGLNADTIVILFSGKLVPAKQPIELFDAFAKISRNDTALVFVGDGSERMKLESRVNQRPRKPGNASVHLLPFANQSEMPSRYLLSDIFVLPSRGAYETWGLSVNEAMHMGTPCIVSDRVGCQKDLVEDRKTGWVFSVDDPAGLEGALSTAMEDFANPERRLMLRKRVETKIKGYTYASTSLGLERALEALWHDRRVT